MGIFYLTRLVRECDAFMGALLRFIATHECGFHEPQKSQCDVSLNLNGCKLRFLEIFFITLHLYFYVDHIIALIVLYV